MLATTTNKIHSQICKPLRPLYRSQWQIVPTSSFINVLIRFRVFFTLTIGINLPVKLTAMANPKLIVFDLDYTLWPFWVDTHVDPPFRMEQNGEVYDIHKRLIKFYPEVPEVLNHLHSSGYKLGVASRTSCRTEANDLIRLFKWDPFFDFREIYPGSKVPHFKKLQKESGFAFEDMIFFDDEHRNIQEVQRLGVLCILVPDGVTKELVADALKQFAQRRQGSNVDL